MKTNIKTLISLLWLTFAGFACSPEPELTPDMLGGGILFDPSLYKPEDFLVSRAIPNPTSEQALKPVIIACHGYTATTFEWDEFKTWAGGRSDFYLSQVLLGGHGRNYDDFKNASWQDWQASIKEEYERLEKAGYRNISLLGSSTSGALLLELVASGYFFNRTTPRNLLLIDPIVIPSNKTLSLVGVLGPVLGYLETDQSGEEDKVFYRFRPQETLQELQQLLKVVRKDLEKGITLPPTCKLKVYKSKKDDSADPVSAVLIHKGVKTAEGKSVDIELIDSEIHVYTRLQLRANVTAKDRENQTNTFADIISRVLR
jgi:carboxylesterase